MCLFFSVLTLGLSYLGVKFIKLQLLKGKCEYLFRYFKLAVVMREQAKAAPDDNLSRSGQKFK